MFAVYLLEAGAEETGLGWLVWVALAVFLLMVFLGWLVTSKGWLKQEEEVAAPAHGHDDHAEEPAHRAEAVVLPDDLTIIEGIGPKVAKLLAGTDITTFAALAEADLVKLREVLDGAGYKYMEPAGWVEQAKLAAKGDTEGLQKLQGELKGGRKAA
jgi:predicted flap endonuclease-1-like 5' DNA nuclease